MLVTSSCYKKWKIVFMLLKKSFLLSTVLEKKSASSFHKDAYTGTQHDNKFVETELTTKTEVRRRLQVNQELEKFIVLWK